MRAPVAVISGAGIITSVGLGRAEVHQALCEGRRGLRENASFEGLESRWSGTLVDYDASQYLNRRQLRLLDRPTRGLLSAIHQGMAEAGSPVEHYPSIRSGVVVVSTYTATGNLILFHREVLVSGPRFVNPLFFSNTMFSTHMMQASLQHHLQGITIAVSTGETASLDGLLHACRALERGQAELMVVAGSENIFLELQEYFIRAGLLASGGVEAGGFGPYDSESGGTVLGECAGAVILEEPGRAAARGAPVLAEVVAVASRSGEQGGALRGALEQVLAEGEVGGEPIRFVMGSGSGVVEQDRVEAAVLSEVLGRQGGEVAVTSLKGSLGECLSTAGLNQMVTAIQVGVTGKLPPVVGTREPVAELKLRLVRDEPLAVERGLALLTTRGHMGGAAVALLRV